MELLLIAIVLGALLLAVFMSVVAWRLLREDRSRSNARVAALEALASTALESDSRGARPVPVRGRPLDYDDPIEDTVAADALRADDADDEPAAGSACAHGRVTYDATGEELEAAEDPDDAGDRKMGAPDDDWDFAIRPEHQEPDAVADRVRLTVRQPAPARAHPPRPRAAAIHDDMFGSAMAAPLRPRRQGLAALFMAMAVLVLGTGAVYAVRSAPSLAGVARRMTAPDPASTPPLELLSLKHNSDPTGTFTVTGLVQNPVEGASLTNIVAVVYLFDADGRYFASGRAVLDRSPFRPGEESPFVVEVPRAGLVSRYRIGFRFEDGGVVAHIDHRGELPRGTSGDAVHGVDGGTGHRPAAPHRVEG